MTEISISSDFWAGCMMPEGILERWRVPEGSYVEAGAVVAEIRIEDALHELTAPVRGRLVTLAKVNDIIEPGTVIGRLG